MLIIISGNADIRVINLVSYLSKNDYQGGVLCLIPD